MGDNAKPIDAANQVNNELDPETGILSSISQTNIAINQFTEIINRPLFVEGRMPSDDENQSTDALPKTSPLKLTLEGVVISPGSRVAVVKDDKNNNILRLVEGMSHNGWKVNNIQSQSVEFVRGDDVQTINIEIVRNPPVSRIKSPTRLPSKKITPRR
jgi:hypothetical protein